MDYGIITNSAVPHIATLSADFQIQYAKYQYTLIIQCSFIILILPLLAIWLYFSAKYKKQKKKDDQLEQQKKQMGNSLHMSEVDAKSQFIDQENHRDTMKQQYNMDQADKSNEEEVKQKLQVVERKICYGVCFFIFHIVAVNSYDTGILSIVSFYLTLAVYLGMNVIWGKKKIFVFGLYILPAIVSPFQFWIGKHVLVQSS